MMLPTRSGHLEDLCSTCQYILIHRIEHEPSPFWALLRPIRMLRYVIYPGVSPACRSTASAFVNRTFCSFRFTRFALFIRKVRPWLVWVFSQETHSICIPDCWWISIGRSRSSIIYSKAVHRASCACHTWDAAKGRRGCLRRTEGRKAGAAVVIAGSTRGR